MLAPHDISISYFHPLEYFKYSQDLFYSNENRFLWIKKVVTNHMCLINDCWFTSQKSFYFIKNICEYHNYEVFVYASNIEDYNVRDSRDLWNNIQLLSPSMVVKTESSIINKKMKMVHPILTCYIFGYRINHPITNIKTQQFNGTFYYQLISLIAYFMILMGCVCASLYSERYS